MRGELVDMLLVITMAHVHSIVTVNQVPNLGLLGLCSFINNPIDVGMYNVSRNCIEQETHGSSCFYQFTLETKGFTIEELDA